MNSVVKGHERAEVNQSCGYRGGGTEAAAIQPGFELEETVPERRKEREDQGKKWFDMPAPKMTEEIKDDLQVIQIRPVLDPTHFYKKNVIKALPRNSQIGKVIDSPLDYYNGRLMKKQRKLTIDDELVADVEFSKFMKTKYKEKWTRSCTTRCIKTLEKIEGKE